MPREPDWREDEFWMLLKNSDLSSDELSLLLQSRSAGAIETVRQGVAAFRAGRDHSMLSQMMVRVLEEIGGQQ